MQVKPLVAKHTGNIKAYVYHEPALIARHSSKAFPRSHVRHKYSRTKPRINSDRNKLMRESENISSQDNAAQFSGKKNKLLVILHNKIQQAVDDDLQSLPPFFKGRYLVVRFKLLTNGRISSILFLKKSGVEIIDRQVGRVLSSIVLARIAQRYLRKSALLRVHIIIS